MLVGRLQHLVHNKVVVLRFYGKFVVGRGVLNVTVFHKPTVPYFKYYYFLTVRLAC